VDLPPPHSVLHLGLVAQHGDGGRVHFRTPLYSPTQGTMRPQFYKGSRRLPHTVLSK
jgi:hypothetical protein